MGYPVEFNWLLKLAPKNGFDEVQLRHGEEYSFCKSESRIYPVGIPIDLANQNWEILAKIKILSFSVDNENTSGKYVVLRLYNDEERKFLNKYWKETTENM